MLHSSPIGFVSLPPIGLFIQKNQETNRSSEPQTEHILRNVCITAGRYMEISLRKTIEE